MSDLYLCSQGGRTAIRLAGAAIKSGGEGDIFRIEDYAGCLAKIYHGRNTSSRFNRDKIEAMIARPPEHMTASAGTLDLPLFAWPTHVIENASGQGIGFLMPEIPTDRAVTLAKYMSRQSGIRYLSDEDRSLPRRYQLCRNLAAAIGELHRQHHYFVDLKPENIFMFKDTGIICLIDNDGFSIDAGNGTRFAAQTYTSQYLAPELLRKNLSPSSITNDSQDRFALAALMFQILNNGLHPFQGVPLIETEDWNVDYCVRNGFYPCGLQPNPSIRPSEASVHDCWEQSTRLLFDRAFTGAHPEGRPTAVEWRNHLNAFVLSTDKFIRCEREPSKVLHIHLGGLPCPECRLTDLVPEHPMGGPAIDGIEVPPPDPNNRKWLYMMLGIAVFIILTLLAVEFSNK